MFRTLVGKVNKHQIGPHDTIKKVLNCRYLKCLHIVQLDLICMNYDFFKNKSQIPTLESRGQMRFD